MLKIRILSYIITGLKKMIQCLNNIMGSVDNLRYGALMSEQTCTYKTICLTSVKMRKLGEEKMRLQDKYEYIQQLKEECMNTNKE